MSGEMKDALEAAGVIVAAEDYANSRGRTSFWPAKAVLVARALLSTDKAEWNYDIGATPRDGSHFVVLCTRMDEPPIAWRPHTVPSDPTSSPPTDKAVAEYTALTGPELLAACRDDAHKWADAFCQHAKKQGYDIDKDWMVGWFANAIEHSHDVRTGGGPVVLPDGSAFFVGEVK